MILFFRFVPEREILENKAQLKGRGLLYLLLLLYGADEDRTVQTLWGRQARWFLLADATRC